jgi:hypothetical protein
LCSAHRVIRRVGRDVSLLPRPSRPTLHEICDLQISTFSQSLTQSLFYTTFAIGFRYQLAFPAIFNPTQKTGSFEPTCQNPVHILSLTQSNQQQQLSICASLSLSLLLPLIAMLLLPLPSVSPTPYSPSTLCMLYRSLYFSLAPLFTEYTMNALLT